MVLLRQSLILPPALRTNIQADAAFSPWLIDNEGVRIERLFTLSPKATPADGSVLLIAVNAQASTLSERTGNPMTENKLSALYYPFSRTLDETTLKRAVLLYDEIIFVDPTSPGVRAGLYDVEQHQQYLPNDAAQQLSDTWSNITSDYALLQEEGLVRFVDPAPLLAKQRLARS